MRPISEYEKGLLKALLDAGEFAGRPEIVEQLSTAQVQEIDPDGSLRFVVACERKAPVKTRVPVEAEFLDTDGMHGHLLLHVVDGRVHELEIYKDDLSRVIKRPQPADLEIFIPPDDRPSPADRASRKQILQRLLALNEDLGKIREELRCFPWESIELVTLTANQMRSVIQRFLKNELSARQVEDWAETIECRDDIAYDDTLNQFIFELANPDLQGNLTLNKAEELLLRLDMSEGSHHQD